MKGAWTPTTAIKLARHYDETIDSEEAKKRATATNDYNLNQARNCIEIAAQIACSNWLTLLWRGKTKPSNGELTKETDRLKAKKSLAYQEAHCMVLSLQIDDTALTVEQTGLLGIEYFGSYYLTRLTAAHQSVYREISMYSKGTLKDIFSTSKSVEIDGGQLITDIVRLMPEEAHNKESVVHRLAIGFAPSGEVFDLWVHRQTDKLREKYEGQVANEELKNLLNRLQQKAFEAKERHDRDRGDENKISAKDITYFNRLLKEELGEE